SSSTSSTSGRYSPSLSSTTTWQGRTGHCASGRLCRCCARSRGQCNHGQCSAVCITCTSEQPDHQRSCAPSQVPRVISGPVLCSLPEDAARTSAQVTGGRPAGGTLH